MPDPVAWAVRRIHVARVMDTGKTERTDGRLDLAALEVEHGAQDTRSRPQGPFSRNAGKAERPATAHESEEQGLQVVVALLREEQD